MSLTETDRGGVGVVVDALGKGWVCLLHLVKLEVAVFNFKASLLA
jgi:hypothetical protein